MPEMTREQLIEALAKKRIGAVSIDTSVFDSKQKNFRQADFRSIVQFRRRNFAFVIVDVIAREMMKHLALEAEDSQKKLRSALRSHNLRWHREQAPGEQDALLLDADPSKYAIDEFQKYLEYVDGRILAISELQAGLEELFRRYFAIELPFGKGESRKHEFPDAAALLRIEAFAKETNTMVLCIAQDKSWTDFAKSSEHLVTVYPLNVALGLLNEAYTDQDLANNIVDLWQSGTQTKFEQDVYEAIDERFSYVDFLIDAESGVNFESEAIAADLLDVQTDTLSEPVVLAADDETVTFSLSIDVKGRFNAGFYFYVYDNIDKEYIGIGSEYVEKIETVNINITITADRAASDSIKCREISVSEETFNINFGYVDISYHNRVDYDRI